MFMASVDNYMMGTAMAGAAVEMNKYYNTDLTSESSYRFLNFVLVAWGNKGWRSIIIIIFSVLYTTMHGIRRFSFHYTHFLLSAM